MGDDLWVRSPATKCTPQALSAESKIDCYSASCRNLSNYTALKSSSFHRESLATKKHHACSIDTSMRMGRFWYLFFGSRYDDTETPESISHPFRKWKSLQTANALREHIEEVRLLLARRTQDTIDVLLVNCRALS